MSSSIEARTRGVIARVFQLAPAQQQGPLTRDDVPAWDSLAHMQLIAALDDEFAVQVPGFAISEMTSLDAILRELVAAGASGQ